MLLHYVSTPYIGSMNEMVIDTQITCCKPLAIFDNYKSELKEDPPRDFKYLLSTTRPLKWKRLSCSKL